MQDFSVVRTQGSSTRFLFSYHSAILENLFKGYFFTTRAEFGVVFSINFISSPAFLGFWKALEQGAMSSSVSTVGRRIVLNEGSIWFSCMYNFISNIFLYANFKLSQKRHCYQLHWNTLFQECLWKRLINSQHIFYRVQIHSPSACDFKPDKKNWCSFIKRLLAP